jgi:uncharacterized membrane protein
MARLWFWVRQVGYDLGSGLLLRPIILTLAYVLVALLAVEFEPSRLGLADAGAAQVVLGTIAGSMMTVVAVVFSILLMALSLASTQFSPRILGGFLRDPTSQWTLGVFVGTFAYSLVVLRAVRSGEPQHVPELGVLGAIALTFLAVGALIYFIHHIAHGIQANHIVARIADEAAAAIDENCPARAEGDDPPEPSLADEDAADVPAPRSGYVQLVGVEALAEAARAEGACIRLLRAPGDFVVEGGALARVAPADAAARLGETVAAGVDLGEVRTLQQDVLFGLRQLVDVALKSISPAVNDPSTAATCVDHLSSLLCRLAHRRMGHVEARDADGTLRLLLPGATFEDAVDLAFNQLRQYARNDLSVSLRLLQAARAVAGATRAPSRRARVWHQAKLVAVGLSPSFSAADRAAFDDHVAALRASCAPAGERE